MGNTKQRLIKTVRVIPDIDGITKEFDYLVPEWLEHFRRKQVSSSRHNCTHAISEQNSSRVGIRN